MPRGRGGLEVWHGTQNSLIMIARKGDVITARARSLCQAELKHRSTELKDLNDVASGVIILAVNMESTRLSMTQNMALDHISTGAALVVPHDKRSYQFFQRSIVPNPRSTQKLSLDDVF